MSNIPALQAIKPTPIRDPNSESTDGTIVTYSPEGKRFLHPASMAPRLRELGWRIGAEVPTTVVSSLLGLGQGVTLGHGDELAGALNAVRHPLTEGAYHQGREAARDQLTAAQANHPDAYGRSELAGQLGAGAALGAAAGPVGGAALAGALQGEGDSAELDADAVRNAVVGGTVGAGLGAALGPGAKAAGKAVAGAAPRVFNAVHSLTPAELGAATPAEAAQVTARTLESHPELWKTGGDASLAAAGKGVLRKAGDEMESAQRAQTWPATTARDFHNEIESGFTQDLAADPSLRAHLDKVHRFARQDRYAQLFHDAKAHGMPDRAAEHMATLMLRHDNTPMTLREMQEAGNALKSKLDLYNANPNRAFSGDSPLTPKAIAERAHSSIGEQVGAASDPWAADARAKYGQAAQLLGPVQHRAATRAEALPTTNPLKPLQTAKAWTEAAAGALHVPEHMHNAPAVAAKLAHVPAPLAAPVAQGLAGPAAPPHPSRRHAAMAHAAKLAATQGQGGAKGAALDLLSRETSPVYRDLQHHGAAAEDKNDKASETFAGPQRK